MGERPGNLAIIRHCGIGFLLRYRARQLACSIVGHRGAERSRCVRWERDGTTWTCVESVADARQCLRCWRWVPGREASR